MLKVTNLVLSSDERQVDIYRLGRDVEVPEPLATLSGEDVLPVFVLDDRYCDLLFTSFEKGANLKNTKWG